MADLNIFVSVGGTSNEEQEIFVRAVEDRLRSEGLIPHTVGRNTFSSDAPLKTVAELLDKCSGTVVIALERVHFAVGTEKRGGSKEIALSETSLPTPWNQIEAALSYSRGLPLLVIVAEGIRSEGLLEPGYDWYVQNVTPEAASLHSNEFNGVLASWKNKVASTQVTNAATINPSDMSVGTLLYAVKPAQLWGVLVALGGIVAGAFALGLKLAGGA
ncbi:hypothetical protein [Vreelandella zhanjiangensis]|uniref:hypothetical protein n=1 Tax=Vreelandella zhanjiangensis TaxID=1121960 RepID=UPI0003610F55|nr:hypothetical protein [Halomonas zhanjiangensis]